MNVIVWLEFELVQFESVVNHFNNYVINTLFNIYNSFFIKRELMQKSLVIDNT